MSNYYYNELWRTTYNDVENLQRLDNTIEEDVTEKPKKLALTQILPIYVRYRNVIKRLICCYDQMIQSQMREYIKRLLAYSIGRMLEYRREIVKLNCSEYEWPDDLLIKMKWTPDDIAISPPSSYISDRKDELDKRRFLIDNLIQQSELSNKLENSESINETRPIAGINLNSISPKMEISTRANEDNNNNIKLIIDDIQLKNDNIEDIIKASVTIQRYWRGHSARKNIKNNIDKIEKMIGMKFVRVNDKSIIDEDGENFRRRQELQSQALIHFYSTISDERARIFKMRGPTLKEDIEDEIHEWFNHWYSSLGHFDIYPTVKAGGTILVATGQSLTPEEYYGGKNVSKRTKKRKRKRKREDSRRKRKIIESDNWIMPKSKVIQNIINMRGEFNENWNLRDNSNDLNRREYIDLIHNDIYYELQLKIRKTVDELMRLELNRLNNALMKDHKYDNPKFTFPGMKKNKRKKKWRRTGKRKIVKKIVTQEEIDVMFNELVLARIIKNYPMVKLDQWIGDISYQNYEAKKNHQHYYHGLGEVKQTIIDYCILPFGTKQVHTFSPLIKSVCIVGLSRTGKSFITNAICSAVGGLLFDLTPSNLIGKYNGKANGKKLMKMIGILARHYPPGIVMIDGGDKPWWKKIPLRERPMNPRRLAKLLPKFIKSIKRGDQILVLGLASQPWKSKKRFYNVYNKFIIIPSTDYNTLYIFYQNILMNYHGIDGNFDLSSLTKATIGYPLGVIREAIDNVLNVERERMLKVRPLLPEEILTELIKWTGPKDKVTRNLEKFVNKTPLGRKKLKMMRNTNRIN